MPSALVLLCMLSLLVLGFWYDSGYPGLRIRCNVAYMSTHDSIASCMILFAAGLLVCLMGAWLLSSSSEM